MIRSVLATLLDPPIILVLNNAMTKFSWPSNRPHRGTDNGACHTIITDVDAAQTDDIVLVKSFAAWLPTTLPALVGTT